MSLFLHERNPIDVDLQWHTCNSSFDSCLQPRVARTIHESFAARLMLSSSVVTLTHSPLVTTMCLQTSFPIVRTTQISCIPLLLPSISPLIKCTINKASRNTARKDKSSREMVKLKSSQHWKSALWKIFIVQFQRKNFVWCQATYTVCVCLLCSDIIFLISWCSNVMNNHFLWQHDRFDYLRQPPLLISSWLNSFAGAFCLV